MNVDWVEIGILTAAGMVCAAFVSLVGGAFCKFSTRQALRAVARGRLTREAALQSYRASARTIFIAIFYGSAIVLTALYVTLILTPDLPFGLSHRVPSEALMQLVAPSVLVVLAIYTLMSEPKRITNLLPYPFDPHARRSSSLKGDHILLSDGAYHPRGAGIAVAL